MFASRCSEAAAAASFCLISACSRSGDSRVRSRTSFQLRKSERSLANTMGGAGGGHFQRTNGATYHTRVQSKGAGGAVQRTPWLRSNSVFLQILQTTANTARQVF